MKTPSQELVSMANAIRVSTKVRMGFYSKWTMVALATENGDALLVDCSGMGKLENDRDIQPLPMILPQNRAERRGNKTSENGITKRFRKQPWRKNDERE